MLDLGDDNCVVFGSSGVVCGVGYSYMICNGGICGKFSEKTPVDWFVGGIAQGVFRMACLFRVGCVVVEEFCGCLGLVCVVKMCLFDGIGAGGGDVCIDSDGACVCGLFWLMEEVVDGGPPAVTGFIFDKEVSACGSVPFGVLGANSDVMISKCK